MRNVYVFLTALVSCVLLFQFGCQGVPLEKQAAVEKTTAAQEANKPEAKITFENLVHDFGEVGEDTRNTCEFKFTNTGKGILKIEKVQSTCGCAVPDLSKYEYAPGESGTIKVTYSSGSHVGSVNKYLYVPSNDKENPRVALTIKATITKKVDFEPKVIELLLRSEAEVNCPEITLTGLDGKPFFIRRFKATADCLTADFNSFESNTKFVLKPKVDIDKLRKSLRGRIDISISHPGCGLVTIYFNALPEFKVSPASLYILDAKPLEPITREVWMFSNYGKTFEIESTSSKEGIIKVLSQEKSGDGYKFVLEVKPPATDGKKRFFADTFLVNIKGGEKLEINCNGFYSSKLKNSSSR